jgi:hypothetical protein
MTPGRSKEKSPGKAGTMDDSGGGVSKCARLHSTDQYIRFKPALPPYIGSFRKEPQNNYRNRNHLVQIPSDRKHPRLLSTATGKFSDEMDSKLRNTMTIEAAIDSVECLQDHDGAYVMLQGWTFAGERNIMTIALWANETCLGYLPYGCFRPDVSSTFGVRCLSASVGFKGKVRLPDPLVRVLSLKLRLVITASDLTVKELTVLESLVGGWPAAGNRDGVE